MSTTVKFNLRIVKFLEPMTSLPSDPTGPRKNISTIYEDLSSISDIVSKISEFFSNENSRKFTFSGSSLSYDEEKAIEIDTEELTERLEKFFQNAEKYGDTSWSQGFDAQGVMEINWSSSTKYIAQLIMTEPKEEIPVIIYPQVYTD